MSARDQLVRVTESHSSNPFADAKVDRQASVIRDVMLCGERSVNDRYYTEALGRSDCAEAYSGVPVFVNHGPNETPNRDLKDKVGWIESPRRGPNGASVRGDLRLNPKHPMAETLMWWAENAPNEVPMSHVASMVVGPRPGGGLNVRRIAKVHEVDFVDRGGTTRTLFESARDPLESIDPATYEGMHVESIHFEKSIFAAKDNVSTWAESRQLKGEIADGGQYHSLVQFEGKYIDGERKIVPIGAGVSLSICKIKKENLDQVADRITVSEALATCAMASAVASLPNKTAKTVKTSKGKNMDPITLAEASLDSVIKERPDLLEAFKTHEAESDAQKALIAERDSLKNEKANLQKKLDDFDAKEKTSARRSAVTTIAEELKLPKTAMSDLFVDQLVVAKDDAAVRELVKDRLTILGVGRPRSSEKTMAEQAGANGKVRGSGATGTETVESAAAALKGE